MSSYYIGLMSGTSLDGVDGVVVKFEDSAQFKLVAACYLPFTSEIYQALSALQVSGTDEIRRASQVANQLVCVYADCVMLLLKNAQISPHQVAAIGVHGQTVRHCPEMGWTSQINNPSLLAELTGIDVIADFRSRDIAAGGQGAPLVPAFHRSVFAAPNETRVVVNLGGITNISILRSDGSTHGFDTGPGNMLMDAWIMQHQSKRYDANGDWARQGHVNVALLEQLKDEPFFSLAPPKSTGRDLFDLAWLEKKLSAVSALSPVDVQATLCAFTAQVLVDAIRTYAADVRQVYICGGGVHNATLLEAIKTALAASTSTSNSTPVSIESTEGLGVSPNHVEALAFAWLAYCHKERLAGNLPEVTGAAGGRILGGLYPR